jgi:protein-tyrosine phosphatase
MTESRSLFLFGKGSYQVGIGHEYLVAQSQPSISRCICEVSELVTRHFRRAYNVPLPENDEISHLPVPHVDKIKPRMAIGIRKVLDFAEE